MRSWLPTLIVLGIACPASRGQEVPKALPGSSLLPDGSQLHGVVIPRHNKQRQLVSSLMADVVTMVNDELMAGSRVTIDFYNNRGNRNARIKLKEATFNQTIGMMHATEEVTIDADSYRARGTGMHYAIRDGQGFLNGPATTWIINPPQTAMNPKTSAIIGATGIALISHSPVPVTAEITTQPAVDPVMVRTVQEGPIAEARRKAGEQAERDARDSKEADSETKAFVEKIPLDYEALTGSKETAPPSEPLDFKPSPEHTVVNCDGGMYFDADKGLLVYLKNVRVDDPQYTLSGADVLKIFMSKKKPSPAANAAPKPDDKAAGAPKEDGPVPAMGGNFDSVEKIIATGAVRILQKAVKKGEQPVEASGAIFTYHPKTGDIILSGGYPWVKQGDFFARAKQPNLVLRMKKDGSFVTEGNWEMGGRLNQR